MRTEKTIGYLGSEGSYSHQAANYLRPNLSQKGFNSFSELVSATEKGDVSEAVLPIENSASGRIPDVHRLVSSMELFIVEEYLLSIDHCLVALRRNCEERITTVYSHPQGFIQSSKFLAKEFPNVTQKTTTDTATAIKEMVNGGDESVAAIGSEFAANLYSAVVINKHISDRTDNTTRFVLLSDTASLKPENDMTSLIIQVKHTPGALVAALDVFGAHKVNITKLETYMISDATSVPTFYLDLGCGSNDEKLVDAMNAIRPHITFVKFLGSYISDPSRSGTNGFLRP